MCVAGVRCVGGCGPHCLCVCVCVCVRACFFPFHTRKGALMLYTLYVDPTMGHLEAPMKRCTRGWSSRMASSPGTLGVAHWNPLRSSIDCNTSQKAMC